MRKLKVILMSVAILTAISSAWASHKRLFCEDLPQYYLGAGGYQPAGEFGVEYVCLIGVGACTYYKPNPVLLPNVYLPCRIGFHTFAYQYSGTPGQARGSH